MRRAESSWCAWWQRGGSMFFFGSVATLLVVFMSGAVGAPRASASSPAAAVRLRPTASPSPAVMAAVVAAAAAPSPSGAPQYITGAAAAARLYTAEGMAPDAAAALAPSRLAPATHEAQMLIWRSQNPDDCAGAQYLVSRGHTRGNGIGSLMHVTGYHLAVAVEEGRVFLFSEKTGEEWTDASCGAARNWECFFRAPSRCSREHLKNGNYVEMELHHSARALPSSGMPAAARALLRAAAPHLSDDAAKYWWRAQSVAYLMRLNEATRAAVRALRQDAALISLAPAGGGGALSAQQAATIPLPPGVIHAHVRHGDKYTEMLLQGTARYTNASAALVLAQPFSLRKALFVSTEDPGVPEEAAALLGQEGWTVLHYTIRRSNRGPLQQLQDLGEDSAATTTRTHLQQMLLSLEADAWVGTRGSNWNRLLDELRCTWCVRGHWRGRPARAAASRRAARRDSPPLSHAPARTTRPQDRQVRAVLCGSRHARIMGRLQLVSASLKLQRGPRAPKGSRPSCARCALRAREAGELRSWRRILTEGEQRVRGSRGSRSAICRWCASHAVVGRANLCRELRHNVLQQQLDAGCGAAVAGLREQRGRERAALPARACSQAHTLTLQFCRWLTPSLK